MKAAAAALVSASLALGACNDSGSSNGDSRTPSAGEASLEFSDPRTIDNPYLPLTAHRRCEQRGEEKDGTLTRSVLTVLDKPKRFDVEGARVDAAVIRDDAYEDGELVERTHDYFAQADDGTVYYMGEDVANLRNEKVLNNRGTWLYGRDTDVPGVAMPADPELGDQWNFEDVPGTTTESNRVEEVGMRAKAGGKVYNDVIRIQEFIQPEGEIEYKLYAPGVGKIIEYPPDGRAEFSGCG